MNDIEQKLVEYGSRYPHVCMSMYIDYLMSIMLGYITGNHSLAISTLDKGIICSSYKLIIQKRPCSTTII